MLLNFISKVFQALLWLATLASALVWILIDNPPFNPEPVTVVLGLISTAVTGLMRELESRIRKEEYSLSYALAYGYVNNFIEPVITSLLQRESDPKLIVYMPAELGELEPRNIERIMARIKQNFSSEIINLDLKEGRTRDVITIYKSQQSKVFFDFPSTLLTLNSLLDYKLESKIESFLDAARKKMGLGYIEKFKETLKKILQDKAIAQYVHFADKELIF